MTGALVSFAPPLCYSHRVHVSYSGTGLLEVQSIHCPVATHTFTLGFRQEVTPTLTAGATAATIKSALQALSTCVLQEKER